MFEILKEEQPNFREKLKVIPGNFEMEENLFDSQIKDILENEVNIIIHCAATVRFDEPLKRTAIVNLKSTLDLLALARNIQALKVNIILVLVSISFLFIQYWFMKSIIF